MNNPNMSGATRVEAAIRMPKRIGRPAIVAYLTGGFPDPARFREQLIRTSRAADVVEVGVPFRDPMADGPVLQRAAHAALDRGASLAGILDELDAVGGRLESPVVLMGYYNPFLKFGIRDLAERIANGSATAGILVPDLPLEESSVLRGICDELGLAFPQLVPPTSSEIRTRALCRASRGFVYAVTARGTTGCGGHQVDMPAICDHVERVRTIANDLPVCAGFGISATAHIERLAHHADGVIVGSALVDAIAHGIAADTYLDTLMETETADR